MVSASKMSKLVGCIEPFVAGGNFKSYEDRLRQFYIINDVQKEAETPLFITLMGAEIYEILSSLTVPDPPSSQNFEFLLGLLRKHFTPKCNKRAERYKFYKAAQEENEPLNEYIVRLKSLAQNCCFGDFLDVPSVSSSGALAAVSKCKLQILNDALSDRFIIGIRSEKIQQTLLNEDNFDFEQYCTRALNMELSERATKSIQPTVINAVKSRSSQGQNTQQRSGYHQGHRRRNQNQNANARQLKNNSGGSFGRNFNDQGSKQNGGNSCRRCGRHHNEAKCPAVNWECFKCQEKGHTSLVCSKPPKNKVNGIFSQPAISETSHSSTVNNLVNFCASKTCNLDVEGKNVCFEIDTGACVTIMSKVEFQAKFFNLNLISKETNKLHTITGQNINELGKVIVDVVMDSHHHRLELVVVDENRPFVALLGRTWLDTLFPHWRASFNCGGSINRTLNQSENLIIHIEQKFFNVISRQLISPIIGFEAEILLKENATPIFHAAYNVPYLLRDKVEAEIVRLCNEKILVPRKYSRWASPLVVIPKSNGDIRLCVDCKVTINKFIQMSHYPLPKIEDIFASLAGCKVFCVLDLTGAYQQLAVSQSSQELLTVNTMKGLFAYTRLAFGVASAPSLFQSVMDQILLGLKQVFCYLDDILIGGASLEECRNNLFEVLGRLQRHNVRINLSKCKFLTNTVSYLGHVITPEGIRPNKEKIKSIVEAPPPRDLLQLQSYLGLLNYYGRFIPNLSHELSAMYKLLRKGEMFVWSGSCQAAFDKSKELILSNNLLEVYDPKKPIIVATDASPYGVAAVLSHVVDGVEKPVLFASSSLSPAERNYSQLHREALAIIFAVKRFHNYIYGNIFTIYTDHQALRTIFSPSKGTAAVAAARLQRWAVILSMYQYKIVYRKAFDMRNADALSRLPLPEPTQIESVCINYFNYAENKLVDVKAIAESVKNDTILRQVYQYLLNGWPSKTDEFTPEIRPYYLKRNSLSTEDDRVYYGSRIVVPPSLQKSVLNSLHENHTGIVRMKASARAYVWWPGIDTSIENFVKSCSTCQGTQRVPKEIVVTTWPIAKYPMERIHLDFFYFEGKNFLIMSDAFSKYIDVKLMGLTTVNCLIDKLEEIFVVFGLPTQIVTDNGPPFFSHVFAKYCECHGIKLTKSPPYHPQSNGQAERAVQSVKTVFRKFCLGAEAKLSWPRKINKFLIHYRNSPSTVTSKTPSEMIFSFKPKVILDCINNKPKINFDTKDHNNVCHSDQMDPSIIVNSKFKKGEELLYRNHYKSFVHWIPATILKVISPLTYLIDVNSNVRFVHENQLRKVEIKDKLFLADVNPDIIEQIPYNDSDTTSLDSNNLESKEATTVELRRSKRRKMKTKRFTFSEFK